MAREVFPPGDAARTQNREGSDGAETGGSFVLDVAQGMGLRAVEEDRFARGTARTSRWCAVEHRVIDWAPRSPSGGRSERVRAGRNNAGHCGGPFSTRNSGQCFGIRPSRKVYIDAAECDEVLANTGFQRVPEKSGMNLGSNAQKACRFKSCSRHHLLVPFTVGSLLKRKRGPICRPPCRECVESCNSVISRGSFCRRGQASR
jgi:hypothetical protein